ncbi:NAD(P)/FAD-dependent oxidoreductase [Leucobacter sp. M11]|uniref:NAD(P)/FAD-dependent oxidoreductase n=1 Tax=Leucobacter sp. M11 TaxID=2993565 RepID=UPI002D801900|nr:NAD(P)/FAD-dependent oxidoreductase [Leucobacter sp. M11]MEB4616404.1 NAD(P)/FAD-dependent oxidoreductase [Leucobacter sp. M11]
MTEWDVAIHGGGAAGLSAGLVLARTGVRVLVIENRSPRNTPAEEMHGVLSRDGFSPSDYLAEGRAEVVRFGGKILAASVVRTERTPDGTFATELDDVSRALSRALVLATGLRDELPPVPGLEELWGEQVHHCPHCHGAELRGRSLAVIGGTWREMSLHQAQLMRRFSDRVRFFPNGIELSEAEHAELTAIGVTVTPGPVSRVHAVAGGEVRIAAADRAYDAGAVFVAPFPRPRLDGVHDLGLALDERGFVAVDAGGSTSVPGVWAAGNVSDPRAQVINAAAQGSSAAIAITGWLLAADVAAAVRGEEPCFA